jgi:hypothetical protein
MRKGVAIMIRLHNLGMCCLICAGLAAAQSYSPSGNGPATRPPVAELRPPAAADLPENLTTFDNGQAEIQWLDGRWQLRAGTVWLKDFGRHESEAREALRIIRELKLTQVGSLGYPRPVLEYWLANGRAPANTIIGLRTTAFDRENLRVEQVQGQWCLRDARQVLLSFGYGDADARQALAIIRKYGFDQVGYLGQPAPVMILFLAGKAHESATTLPDKHANQPRMLLPNNPFTRQVVHESSKDQAAKETASAGQLNPNDLAAIPSLRQLANPTMRGPSSFSIEDRIAVDWRHVQVRQDSQDWKLLYGRYMLADLGFSESDARVAQAVVQHYHFTEHCLIGRPKALFSYFLVNGQAPKGLCFGAHNTPFRPESLTVQKQGEGWVLLEGTKTLWHFGDGAQEAREALQAIRRYQFDTLCQIGSGQTSMVFLVRTR